MRAYSGAGQVLGHLAEDARLAAGLGALDRVPVAQHLARVLDLDLAEDVRVAADQLLAAVLGDRRRASRAPRSSSSSERKWTWKSTSPSSSSSLASSPRVRGGGQLVGLLDRVRDDRALVLLAVPRALDAQAAGELVEAPQPPLRIVLGGRSAVGRGRWAARGARRLLRRAWRAGVGVAFGAFLQSCVT